MDHGWQGANNETTSLDHGRASVANRFSHLLDFPVLIFCTLNTRLGRSLALPFLSF